MRGEQTNPCFECLLFIPSELSVSGLYNQQHFALGWGQNPICLTGSRHSHNSILRMNQRTKEDQWDGIWSNYLCEGWMNSYQVLSQILKQFQLLLYWCFLYTVYVLAYDGFSSLEQFIIFLHTVDPIRRSNVTSSI